MANNPPKTEMTVIRTKIIINLTLAEEIAGEMVEGSARGTLEIGRCRKFDVESESGLGSRALRRRSNDKSVNVPNRPPR